MGNVELHFLIPRVELISGRAFNVAPPGAEKYFNAFRDYWNAMKGWADPEALATRKDIRSVIESKDRKAIRETLHTAIVQHIEAGEITNHQDLRKYLSGFEELEIKPLTDKQIEKRARQDALEVATKGEKKRRRDIRITLCEIGTTGTDTTYRMEGRIYHEDWTADDYFAAKLTKGSGSTSPRKSAADRHHIVGPDPTRERIAAQRRSLVEAGERQYRATEFFRRRLEETSERLQSLRERIDAKFRATVERIRGRVAEIIASVGVNERKGINVAANPIQLSDVRVNDGPC